MPNRTFEVRAPKKRLFFGPSGSGVFAEFCGKTVFGANKDKKSDEDMTVKAHSLVRNKTAEQLRASVFHFMNETSR